MRFRRKIFLRTWSRRALAAIRRGPRRAAFIYRVKSNAFYLKDNHRISDAYEFFHARGIPVGEANTAVAGSAANRLRIVRAVNADAGFVQPIPKNADQIVGAL